MNDVRLIGLGHDYGGLPVLKDLFLSFPAGSVTALLGPSGCGKTTLLDILAGRTDPTAGHVEGLDGRPVSYVFQESTLLPWRTVRDNLELVLKPYAGPAERRERINGVLSRLELSDWADALPSRLSGGMRQRVSLARAYLFPGHLLLLDEPFRALDLPLRERLAADLARLRETEPRTTIYVTHDLREALRLGDRIVTLSARPARITGILENGPTADRDPESTAFVERERALYQMIREAAGKEPV